MEISYYFKDVYGNATMYIAEPDIALLVSRLTGKKTLSPENKKTLESLGFTFVEIMRPATVDTITPVIAD